MQTTHTAERSMQNGYIARRPYRNSGDMLSILGFGSIVLVLEEQARANRIVAEAVESGINYFDVAPSYGDVFGVRGDAEVKLGPALKPYRRDSFLACKTGCRTRREAEEEFNLSLERLQTDYFDLYQLHGITDPVADVETAFGREGVMDFLLEKRREGRIRYLGFSAHSTAAALAALGEYEFDSVLFAVNYACWLHGGYGPQIMDTARDTGAAALALKAGAKQRRGPDYPEDLHPKCWYEPITDPALMEVALKWTLSRPVTAAVSSGDETVYRLQLDTLRKDIPLALSGKESEYVSEQAMRADPIFPL